MTEPMAAPTDTLQIKYKKDKLRIFHTSQNSYKTTLKRRAGSALVRNMRMVQ
jgi:hypothetical protein